MPPVSIEGACVPVAAGMLVYPLPPIHTLYSVLTSSTVIWLFTLVTP